MASRVGSNFEPAETWHKFQFWAPKKPLSYKQMGLNISIQKTKFNQFLRPNQVLA